MGLAYPKLPVVGVGGVIFNPAGQVLLIKRGQPPGLHMWSIPGGVVELGESLRQACAREMREETGLQVEVGALIDVIETIVPDASGQIEYHYVLFDYLCQARGGQLQAGSDAAQAGWFSLDETRGLDIWPATLALLEKAKGELNASVSAPGGGV